MSTFGTGPILDENFDFVIDSSGDIGTNELERETAELEKDLALNVAETVDTSGLGRQNILGEREDIRIEVVQEVKRDPRVADVADSSIEEDPDDRYRINMEVIATTEDGPFDLVIPL